MPGRRSPGCPAAVSQRPEWYSYLLDAEVPQSAIEHRTIARVAVVNQKSRRPPIPSAEFHYLLGRPLRCRMDRYRDVQDCPVDVPDYKKDIELLKQDCLDAEEIARPYARFMALQEFSPTRGWPSDCVANSYTLRQSSQKP
jgi:hypothetical protein